ncbi:hypothetical protein [Aquimarina aquimarini]|uniref:hypothetical protein n=1 Tax=Aquimarina aquimarini TaxID=1191734 RepID=UPI000D54FB56|nr:hypothetical protein [Aquimarina aquimarini]
MSCNNSSSNDISFYHWKTNLDLTDEEALLFKEVGARKLYCKFFDVSWVASENEAYPKATIQFHKIDTTLIKEIVPVVYITNEVFEKVKVSDDVTKLSYQVLEKIKRLYDSNLKNDFLIKEIQFDCDWTQNTQKVYFNFLNQIKELDSYKELEKPLISATLRLHQIKYKNKTGIPPVDKGVIMFYNTGRVFDIKEENSLLSLNEVAKYTGKLAEYPLQYDVALPTFSWGVVFRNNSFLGLINDITKKDLNDDFEYKNGYYEVKKTTTLKSTFLSLGDKVRLEQPTEKELILLVKQIRKLSSRSDYTVIYYHINSSLSKNLGGKTLQKIIN